MGDDEEGGGAVGDPGEAAEVGEEGEGAGVGGGAGGMRCGGWRASGSGGSSSGSPIAAAGGGDQMRRLDPHRGRSFGQPATAPVEGRGCVGLGMGFFLARSMLSLQIGLE